MTRINFIKNGIWGLLGIGTISSIYAFRIEPHWLEFVYEKISINNLPENLVGKTLMQISDIHVGKRVDSDYLIKSFKQAKEFNPDYVVYTGDYVSYENEEQYKQLDEVLNHCPKGKIGTVGILGNHDYGEKWSDLEVAVRIYSLLNKHGIKVLRNSKTNIEGLNFIGLDDLWGVNFKPEKVMNKINHNLANLVLCHNPDVCDLDIWNGYKGWILSGHTHGGQCKPPFLNPPQLPVKNKKYSAGKIDLEDGRKLYINRALGHFIKVRFNVRPEITIFELDKT